ncbi:hypothetical protein BX600DRAFT_314057 [Xylariales sp. PMI_506]|nr:hypothetical protein BX600DRAFT_314057 [Xylariales sp. PMI_506]
MPLESIYKNPLVKLGVRPRLVFRFGTSMPVPLRLMASSAASPPPLHAPMLLILPPLILGVPSRKLPFTLPFSMRRCFHPSSSRSRRSVFSFSSRSSRSARRAESWFVLSDACNSSIVFRSFSTLSRWRLASSVICAACLSLRSIWDCRSLTTLSTLRTDR